MMRTARPTVAVINSPKEMGMTLLIAHRHGSPSGASERSLTRQDSCTKSRLWWNITMANGNSKKIMPKRSQR